MTDNTDALDAIIRRTVATIGIYHGAEHVKAVERAFELAMPEIRAALTQDKWQPIETAPKDGTDILIANKHTMFIALGDEDEPDYWWVKDWLEERKVYGWTKSSFKPTRWQPLPPPQEQS